MRNLKTTSASNSGNKLSRQSKKSGMSSLIFHLLNSVTVMHIAHLSVKGAGSFAAHCAMGEYYETAPSLIDSLAEQYQGATMSIIEYPSEAVIPTIRSGADACNYLLQLKGMVDMEQEMCMHSEIINVMDEIKSLINTTCYKLNFLS